MSYESNIDNNSNHQGYNDKSYSPQSADARNSIRKSRNATTKSILRSTSGSNRSLSELENRLRHSLLEKSPTSKNESKSNVQNGGSLEFLSRISLTSGLSVSSLSIAEVQIKENTTRSRSRSTLKQSPLSKDNFDSDERFQLSQPKTDSKSIKSSCMKRCCSTLKSLLTFSAFKSWNGVVYVLTYLLGRSAAFIVVYLPTYATRQGFEKHEAALLLTIYGGVDIVSRVFFGFIGDLHFTRPKFIIAFTALCSAISTSLGKLCTDFPSLAVFAATLGFFGSVALSLNTNNIIDMHGLKELGSFLSQSSLLMAFVAIVQYPLLGE